MLLENDLLELFMVRIDLWDSIKWFDGNYSHKMTMAANADRVLVVFRTFNANHNLN